MPHRIRPVLLALATALAALALPAAAFAALEQSATGSASTTAVPDRVIVVWEDGVDRSERAAIREDADTDFVRTLGDPQFQLLSTEPGQSVTDALAALLNVHMTPAERASYITYLDTTIENGVVVASPFDGSNLQHLNNRVRGLLYILSQHPSYAVR